MEAETHLRYLFARVAAVASVLLLVTISNAANFRTQNFLIQAPTPDLAKAVGEAAEKYRNDLAVYWTGKPLRPWPAPCPVRVKAGPDLAAQGVTTYNPAPVRDFQMEVIGTPERILDSVLPHEVTHTVLATYFGRPLPRWADEGICTTVEHDSERSKHEAKLREFLRSRRGIPMNRLFLLTEYPSDVLPMYAQGYSVCRFLIAQKGPRAFIQFLQDYIQHPSWTANVRKHYEYESLAELQNYWIDWVSAGSGPVARFAKVQLPNDRLAGNSELGDSTNLIASVSVTAPTKTPTPEVIPAAVGVADSTSVAQASASTPIPASASTPIPGSASTPIPAALLAASPPTATLASLDSGRNQSSDPQSSAGWYQRQRMKARTDIDPIGNTSSNSASSAVRPIVPPSIRDSGRYQSAQPQEEGGLRRPAAPAERVSGGYDAANRR